LNGTRSEVAKKVDGNEIISTINQSAGVIEFKADRYITVDTPNWKVNEDGSQTCNDINITGGNIQLTGENTNETKFLVKNIKTGYYWDMSPGYLRYYNDKGVQLVNFFPLLSQLVLENSNGQQAYISPIGMHTDGSISAQRIALGVDGSYAPLLYVNGDAQILGTTTLASSPVISSDRELKKEIEPLNDASEFVYSLNPCRYKYINGTSDRYHHGFIAQEVKESMGDDDWGVYVDDKETHEKGLRYEELIADLVATIQSQNERIKALEERLGV
jgi:hypothetical protein